MNKKFAIIGAGIGGLATAIALQKKGFDVSVYESAPTLKPVGAGLVLAANAIKAFGEIGISESVLAAGKALGSVCIKDADGNILTETNSEKLTAALGIVNTFAIHRADLHSALLDHLSAGTVQLNKTCVNFDSQGAKIVLQFEDRSSATADYVVAADGIHSVIRKKLLPSTAPRYSGYTCWRAVTDGMPEAINRDETSETWGRGRRFGIVPLTQNRIYWFACVNAPASDPTMRQMKIAGLKHLFAHFHFPVNEIISHTRDNQLIWGDIVDIKPLKKFAFGNIVLMGDAAHATTPNMGQGACLAIEDAAILSGCLAKYPPEEAFTQFEKKQVARTTTIVNRSWQIGKIAQLENPLLIRLRNFAMKRTPQSFVDKQVNFLADVAFH
jgi:2-polyprenyl-6-methoxyphenol hydroxylase-like FAD-dependent oxidoreductase